MRVGLFLSISETWEGITEAVSSEIRASVFMLPSSQDTARGSGG